MAWEYSLVIENYHAVGTRFSYRYWKNNKKFILCTDSIKARIGIALVLIKLTFTWRNKQMHRCTFIASAV